MARLKPCLYGPKFHGEGHGFSRANTACTEAALAAEVILKPIRRISPPGTYFVTSCTWQRRRIFVVDNMAQLFLRTLFHHRREGRYELHSFVLMPDHFHLLITPGLDTSLERAMQFIKGGFAHAAGEERGHGSPVWERGFTDHRIRDVEDFERHRDYIQANPVRGGIVELPEDDRYCSAFPGFRVDPWPSAAKAANLGAA